MPLLTINLPMLARLLPQRMLWNLVLGLSFSLFVVWDQAHWWHTQPDYSFGFLVPLFVGYILWQRWPRFKALITSQGILPSALPWWLPLFDILVFSALVGALLIFLLGAFLRAAQGPVLEGSLFMAFGLSAGFLFSIFLASQKARNGQYRIFEQRLALTSLFIFPSLIWLLSSPLLEELEQRVSVFLLERVTTIVFALFEGIGFALWRDGNVLHLPRGTVGVTEACSGIRSLTACLFVGAFLSAAFLDKFWKKLLLVGLALLLAFATNLLRSLFLTAWTYAYGGQAIQDQWLGLSIHDWTGYAILLLTSAILFSFLPLFNFSLVTQKDETTSLSE